MFFYVIKILVDKLDKLLTSGAASFKLIGKNRKSVTELRATGCPSR